VIRLFITLFLVLLATVFLGVMSVQKLDGYLYGMVHKDHYAGLTRGTFKLLDESIEGKSGEGLQATVVSIKNRFNSPIDLSSKEQLELPEHAWNIIDSGAIYMHDYVNYSAVFRASQHTDSIWSITMDTSPIDEVIAIATGPLNLVKDKLSVKDPIDQNITA